MSETKQVNGNRVATTYPGPPTPPRERPALSVLIPVYNEAARLPKTLERIRDYVARTGISCQVIIVDDGSRDGTLRAIEHLVWGPLDALIVQYEENRGKGFAVQYGRTHALGQALLICDADLSTPIEEIEKLLPWLDRGYDVVIASRDLPDSVLDPPQPPVRRWMAWVFRALRRRLLLPELRDTQCGFKLFRDTAAARIFPLQTLSGWLFDCEVLALATRLGYRVKEVGVRWQNHPHTRVNPLWEAILALPTLLAIRRRVSKLRPAD